MLTHKEKRAIVFAIYNSGVCTRGHPHDDWEPCLEKLASRLLEERRALIEAMQKIMSNDRACGKVSSI